MTNGSSIARPADTKSLWRKDRRGMGRGANILFLDANPAISVSLPTNTGGTRSGQNAERYRTPACAPNDGSWAGVWRRVRATNLLLCAGLLNDAPAVGARSGAGGDGPVDVGSCGVLVVGD
jgi:hypothetical protein